MNISTVKRVQFSQVNLGEFFILNDILHQKTNSTKACEFLDSSGWGNENSILNYEMVTPVQITGGKTLRKICRV